MRKAFQNRLPLLLTVSLGLLIATLAFSSNKNNSICPNIANCTQPIEKETLKDGGDLLWESLSRQFVVSIVPE